MSQRGQERDASASKAHANAAAAGAKIAAPAAIRQALRRISSAARQHEKSGCCRNRFFPILSSRMERSAIRATNLFLPSAVLHTKRLVAAAAFLADRREIRLERVQILDLALGLADDLGEARDLGIEAGLVLPHFRRGAVVALGLHALGARRKQVRQLLGGILEL